MAEHPITPPPELVEQWSNAAHKLDGPFSYTRSIANQAARWGADQQLELDARWLDHNALNETHLKITPISDVLKEAMRPKPPSLKEQALAALSEADLGWRLNESEWQQRSDTIRRALESLSD